LSTAVGKKSEKLRENRTFWGNAGGQIRNFPFLQKTS